MFSFYAVLYIKIIMYNSFHWILGILTAILIKLFFFSPKPERDAFDTLFDHAPDKLSVVKKVK